LSISGISSFGVSPALQKQEKDIEHKIGAMQCCQTTPKDEKTRTINQLNRQLDQVSQAIQKQQDQAAQHKKDQADGTQSFVVQDSSGGAVPLINIVV